MANPLLQEVLGLPDWPIVAGQLSREFVATPLSGIADDSREVQAGDLFLALGRSDDRDQHILAAFARGARIVLFDSSQLVLRGDRGGVEIGIPDLALRAGEIAHRFFGSVTRELRVIGVTGTNGKTSVTHFIAQMANCLGSRAAVLGTLGYGVPGDLQYTGLTTPGPVRVHRILRALHDQGCQLVAMEVSSHALVQHRVSGVRFTTAILTNITRDHLDYHGDMAQYAAAKLRLFRFPELQHVVLNADDEQGRVWAEQMTAVTDRGADLAYPTVWQYSAAHPCRFTASQAHCEATGFNFELGEEGHRLPVRLPLLGRFNLSNFLAAVAGLRSLGFPLAQIANACQVIEAVPGRLEVIRLPDSEPGLRRLQATPVVIVDFAHTPDALAKALSAVREHVSGRLTVVFGCGGDRDRSKRPLMGQIACEHADCVLVTDDNPRSEDPGKIAEEIAGGCSGGSRLRIVRPRQLAIQEAIQAADAEDVILIAGKGHEDWQEIAGERLPFSDQAQAMAALREWNGERTMT